MRTNPRATRPYIQPTARPLRTSCRTVSRWNPPRPGWAPDAYIIPAPRAEWTAQPPVRSGRRKGTYNGGRPRGGTEVSDARVGLGGGGDHGRHRLRHAGGRRRSEGWPGTLVARRVERRSLPREGRGEA